MLPIIEILSDCESQSAMARVFNTLPPAVIVREEMAIRAIFRQAGWHGGVAALDAEIAHFHAVRPPSGWLDGEGLKPIVEARAYVAIVAGKAADAVSAVSLERRWLDVGGGNGESEGI